MRWRDCQRHPNIKKPGRRRSSTFEKFQIGLHHHALRKSIDSSVGRMLFYLFIDSFLFPQDSLQLPQLARAINSLTHFCCLIKSTGVIIQTNLNRHRKYRFEKQLEIRAFVVEFKFMMENLQSKTQTFNWYFHNVYQQISHKYRGYNRSEHNENRRNVERESD